MKNKLVLGVLHLQQWPFYNVIDSFYDVVVYKQTEVLCVSLYTPLIICVFWFLSEVLGSKSPNPAHPLIYQPAAGANKIACASSRLHAKHGAGRYAVKSKLSAEPLMTDPEETHATPVFYTTHCQASTDVYNCLQRQGGSARLTQRQPVQVGQFSPDFERFQYEHHEVDTPPSQPEQQAFRHTPVVTKRMMMPFRSFHDLVPGETTRPEGDDSKSN